MTADYFRALAARCRRSGRLCFDLYAKEEFGWLAGEFGARATELDAPSETRWVDWIGGLATPTPARFRGGQLTVRGWPRYNGRTAGRPVQR